MRITCVSLHATLHRSNKDNIYNHCLIVATLYFAPASPQLTPLAKLRILHVCIWHRCGFGLSLMPNLGACLYIPHRLSHIFPANVFCYLAGAFGRSIFEFTRKTKSAATTKSIFEVTRQTKNDAIRTLTVHVTSLHVFRNGTPHLKHINMYVGKCI